MGEMEEVSIFVLPKTKIHLSTTNTRKSSKLRLENQEEPKINMEHMEPIWSW